jgi:hypothetical protein
MANLNVLAGDLRFNAATKIAGIIAPARPTSVNVAIAAGSITVNGDFQLSQANVTGAGTLRFGNYNSSSITVDGTVTVQNVDDYSVWFGGPGNLIIRGTYNCFSGLWGSGGWVRVQQGAVLNLNSSMNLKLQR